MEFHVYTECQESKTTFNNIQRAYNAMADLHAKCALEQPAKIFVHGGTYHITSPLHFDGTFPVSIEAYEKEKPVISGAMQLTDWTPCRINGISAFRTVLPPEIRELPFFYVNGKLAQPARYPKQDLFRVTDELSTSFVTDQYNHDNFHYEEGAFDPSWYDLQNIGIVMTHLWVSESLRIESVDTEERKIVTADSIIYTPRKKNTEFYFTNVREALSEPGEYYYDRNTREIFYIPEKKQKNFIAEVPVVGTLARFDSGASWITLKGLSFRCGGNYMPLLGNSRLAGYPVIDLHDNGFAPIPFISETPDTPWKKPIHSSGQGSVHLPGVLFFHNASDCIIEDCEISGCSWYGIQAYQACHRLTFRNNHIHDMGGGGVILNGVPYDKEKADSSLQVNRIVVKGNHIHDCGLIFYASIGIISQHAWGCLLEDNHIHDLYYSGISCGWVWGYAPSAAKENRIHHNHIHDLGKKVLSDMGGIYLLGIQPGTRVWENTIHHITSRYYGGWGLYTDEGSGHIVLERNVVYQCDRSGYHQHYGRENIVRWNIFAFNKEFGLMVTHDNLLRYKLPGESHGKAISFINNVILMDGECPFAVEFEELVTNKRFFLDGNIYYDISGTIPKKFARYRREPERWVARFFTLNQWQKAGMDRHSLFVDPGFKDPEHFDFTLKKDSILRDYGFEDTVKPVK